MRITTLKFKNGYFSVYADGELLCTLSDETVVKQKLKVGMDISGEKAEELIKISEYQSALRDGMRMLAAAAKSRADFVRRLVQKGHDGGAARQAADFLEEKGFIDDEKFAESYVNDAIKLKKEGKNKILFSLKKHGISDETARRALEGKDCGSGLRELAEKEMRRSGDINKVKRRLYSKGYSIWEINSITDELGGSDFEV